MNIKVKAGLQVAGFFVVAIAAATATKFGLDYFADTYGEREIGRAHV